MSTAKFDRAKIGAAAMRAAISVTPVFKANDWAWQGSGTPPSADEIFEAFMELYDSYSDDDRSISSGHLGVTFNVSNDDTNVEEVEFYLDLGSVWPE